MDEKRQIFVICPIDSTFSLNRAEKKMHGEVAQDLRV